MDELTKPSAQVTAILSVFVSLEFNGHQTHDHPKTLCDVS